MLTYDLEKREKVSLYEYLYQCIRDDILSGRIKSGEKLPSKREMAKNHNISVITVENAYAQLIVEGYIYSKEKKGYFASAIISKITEEEPKYSTKLKDGKKDWFVNFNSNHIMYDSFPFSTWSKIMRQTLLDQENSFLMSPSPNGVAQLRNAIADHLCHFRGLEVNPDNIIVGAGMEYLYGMIVQLLGHNKMIALEDPGYKKIGKVYESNGVKCLHLKIDKEGLNINDLKRCNVSAVHISPSHHFPTGIVMPIGRRHHLIEWAANSGSYIIEDDYDSEFRFSGRPIPALAGLDRERVIYMNTFSKTLVPSIRIAYMVLPDKLMEKYRQKLSFYSGTVSSFEQYTLANFIEKGYYERHINRMRNYYKDYRNKIISAIKKSPLYSKVTIEEENAGLHFILGIKYEIDDLRFAAKLRKNGINISGVSDYCYNNIDKFKHKFIINYSAVEEDKLSKALEIMNTALEEQEASQNRIEGSNVAEKGNIEFNKQEELGQMMNRYNGNNNIKMEIPKSVKLIIDVLEQNGFEAFAVGGCVRDTILNRNPQDWDITTSAHPLQVKELFHKTIDTGIKHGTVTVMIGRVGYEVTTYRIDGEYNDNRHPDKVEFTADLIEDLKRRDFTINAMAYNPKIGLVDAFDGIGDIEKKVIRCVGVAEERFGEDALRILRAVRFSAQLGFDIDKDTMNAITEMSGTLEKISAERIRTELEKLLLSDNPDKLITAYKSGITKVVLPEFDRMMECKQKSVYHKYNVGEHTVKVIENVPKTRVMRWAALLHDVAKPEVVFTDRKGKDHFTNHAGVGSEMVPEIMKRMRMDNKTIKTVTRLVACHDDRLDETEFSQESVRRSVHKIGKDIYKEYLELVAADFQGKSDYGKEKGYDNYLYTCEQFDYIIKNNICTSSKEMQISGKDLIALGCPLGEAVGNVLEVLLDKVLTNPELNTYEILKVEAEALIQQYK